MKITEKVAYLKGLADGMKLDVETTEGKILSKMLDILDDIALTVEDHEEAIEDIDFVLETVSCDVDDLMEEVYGDDDDFDDCDFGDDLYEITCDKCDAEITVDFDVLKSGSFTCPKCGETQEFDFVIDDDDCDCGCDHH